MQETPETFDTAVTEWRKWQESPWGRLRYTLAEANLVRHLGDAPRRVLDLGGGDGADAVRLARLGHSVTVVDHSQAMLEAAERRATDANVRIECLEADVLALPADVANGAYDVVLCHNLLPYMDDIKTVLAATVRAVVPAGLVSVMAINKYSAPLTATVRQHDPVAALEVLDATEARTQTFDTKITLHTAEEVGAVMGDLGCPVSGHYGIRSFCDYIIDDELKHRPDFYADLERLELAATNRAPYKHIARLFQLVAIRGRS